MESNVVIEVWQIIGVVLASIAIGGVGAISLVGIVARNLKNDPGAMTAIERLGNSIPAETAEILIKFARSMDNVTDLIEEAVDGVPAIEKVKAVEVEVKG